MNKETRFLKGALRTERANGELFLRGRAASFNVRSEDLGGFYEILQAGCFDEALASNDDTICAVDHDPSRCLGKRSSGTLQLSVDSRGLNYRVSLPNTSYAQDLRALCERGDAQFSSFAFSIAEHGDRWEEISDPENPSQRAALRTIVKVDRLFDVSALSGHPPAYAGNATSMGLADRSLPASMPTELRALVSRAGDDEGDTPDACLCDCENCQDGDCSECSDQRCEDQRCMRDGCPMQNDDRSAGAGGETATALTPLEALELADD